MVPMFIKTTDDIIWFAFNKYNDEYICFPKIIGKYKGKSYFEWYDDHMVELLKYRKKIDGLDELVYTVYEKDIIEKYDPLKFVKNREYLHLKYNFNKYVQAIIEAISTFFDINIADIGIEGSILLNCYKNNSDIDILVFGKNNAKKIQRNFVNFGKYNNISLFNSKQSIEYVKKRKNCGYGENIELMKKQFERRYYGFIFDKQFSIVCVPYESDSGYIDLNRKIAFDGIFEGVLTIIDDDNSCMIPSVYHGVDFKNKKYTIEIYNHYGINQVRKNEKVFVKGKKYKKCSDNSMIIILSFWSNIKERFDLYE